MLKITLMMRENQSNALTAKQNPAYGLHKYNENEQAAFHMILSGIV